MKFSFYIWCLYLILFPFYLFPEGNPQIADVLGTFFIILNIKPILLSLTSSVFTRNMLYFVIYSFLVNTVFMLFTGDFYIFKSSIFYLYSFLFMMAVLHKLQQKDFIKFTVVSILISLFVQLVVWQLTPNQGARAQLLFNNPNQLALWGLSLAIIASCIYSITKSYFYHFLGIAILSTFFILLSASRSAAVCIIAFWLFFIIKSKKTFFISVAVAVVLLFVTLTMGSFNLDELTQINYIYGRLFDGGSGDNGLGERGFDRVIKYPQYLLFGAGEGNVARFNTNLELHSTFLNLIFSYGIIGFFIYMRALSTLLFNSYRDVIILFLILAIFANVHMTLRIPLFWISLGVLFYAKKLNNELEDTQIKSEPIKNNYVRN